MSVKTRKKMDDNAWVRKHFEQLVDTYPGKYAVVAEGELFVGEDAKLLFEKAGKKHPKVLPTGLPIPRPEDFSCLL